MGKKYFIGIDGGGTKTEAVLLDHDGNLLASAKSGVSAIIGKPSAESIDVVKSLRDEICNRSGVVLSQIGYCVLGLNGVDFVDEYEMQYGEFLRCLNLEPGRFALVNDGIAALWGASPSPRGAILQHGTGFTSAYRNGFGNESLFDHLNACQCFDMRVEILKLGARMSTGVVEPTNLVTAVLAHLDLPQEQFPEYYYRNRHFLRRDSKSLMDIVFDLWQKGDAGAKFLVEKAIDDYTMILLAMLKRTGTEGAVAVIGGGVVNSAPERLRHEIARRIESACPVARTQSPEFSPAVGAAIMAAFKYGIEPAGFYMKLNGGSDEKN